jgi:hypothetical protein
MIAGIQEVERELPNGLHDAILSAVHIDIPKREVHLDLHFVMATPGNSRSRNAPALRRGLVLLTGVSSLQIEPPGQHSSFGMSLGIYVDGDFGAFPGTPPPPSDGLVRLWLYSPTWNSRMEFVAKDCCLDWKP